MPNPTSTTEYFSQEQRADHLQICQDLMREHYDSLPYFPLIATNITNRLSNPARITKAPQGEFGPTFFLKAPKKESMKIVDKTALFYKQKQDDGILIDNFLTLLRWYTSSKAPFHDIKHKAIVCCFQLSGIIGNCYEKTTVLSQTIANTVATRPNPLLEFYFMTGKNFDHAFILAQFKTDPTVASFEKGGIKTILTLERNPYNHYIIMDPWLNSVFPLEKLSYYWEAMLKNDNFVLKNFRSQIKASDKRPLSNELPLIQTLEFRVNTIINAEYAENLSKCISSQLKPDLNLMFPFEMERIRPLLKTEESEIDKLEQEDSTMLNQIDATENEPLCLSTSI